MVQNLKCQYHGTRCRTSLIFVAPSTTLTSSPAAGERGVLVEGGRTNTHAAHISSLGTGCGSGFLYLDHTHLLATIWQGGGLSTISRFLPFWVYDCE